MNDGSSTQPPERRVAQEEILQQVRANKAAITSLQEEVQELQQANDELKTMLKPVAEFYDLMRSDIDTLGRFGRGFRSFLAWGAAIVISAGVLIAWAKNGFKFPGG